MISLLNNLSILKNENLICFLNGLETVGDDKAGPSFHQPFRDFLNQEFQTGINRGSRFIQNENFRISQNSKRDGQQLFLPEGNIAGVLVHLHVITTRKSSNKVIYISRFNSKKERTIFVLSRFQLFFNPIMLIKSRLFYKVKQCQEAFSFK